jgi:hypothetical protein
LPTLSLPRQWAAAVGVCFTLLAAERPTTAADLPPIETIVVLYPENRSLDHLYGLFPGANGIANATGEQATQRDHDGQVLPHLRVWDSQGKPDPRFPELANAPFRIDAPPVSLSADQVLLSPIHAYYHNIEQSNGERNDMFAAMSTVGGYTMGYFDGSKMKLWQWAKAFTLADNFFMGAFGGSYLNHQYLICACTPVFKDAPPSMRARLDAQGMLEKNLILHPRATAPCKPTRAAWAARSRRMAFPSTPRSHSISRAAFHRPRGRIGRDERQGQRTPWASLAAANEQDHRRHTIGQGHQLGVVCGRLEGSPCRWHAPTQRETKRDLYA